MSTISSTNASSPASTHLDVPTQRTKRKREDEDTLERKTEKISSETFEKFASLSKEPTEETPDALRKKIKLSPSSPINSVDPTPITDSAKTKEQDQPLEITEKTFRSKNDEPYISPSFVEKNDLLQKEKDLFSKRENSFRTPYEEDRRDSYQKERTSCSRREDYSKSPSENDGRDSFSSRADSFKTPSGEYRRDSYQKEKDSLPRRDASSRTPTGEERRDSYQKEKDSLPRREDSYRTPSWGSGRDSYPNDKSFSYGYNDHSRVYFPTKKQGYAPWSSDHTTRSAGYSTWNKPSLPQSNPIITPPKPEQKTPPAFSSTLLQGPPIQPYNGMYNLHPTFAPKEKKEQITESTLGREYISQIRSGAKTFEGRINAGMFKAIKEGQTIRFFENRNPLNEIYCKIKRILKFHSFEEMLRSPEVGIKKVLPTYSATDFVGAINAYHRIPGYQERAKRSGVLAIQVEPTLNMKK